MIAVHRITSKSPLYNISASELFEKHFDIAIILNGILETTGQNIQAAHSYLNTDIVWGFRFKQIVIYRKDKGSYEINYAHFHTKIKVDTPLCSASRLNSFRRPNGSSNVNNNSIGHIRVWRQN